MKYLLDTHAVTALLNGNEAPGARLRRQRPADIGISSIVAHELFYGAFTSQRGERNVALVDALQFEVLEIDKEDARQAGEVRARGLTLATRNMGEFQWVADLPSRIGSRTDAATDHAFRQLSSRAWLRQVTVGVPLDDLARWGHQQAGAPWEGDTPIAVCGAMTPRIEPERRQPETPVLRYNTPCTGDTHGNPDDAHR